MNCIDSTMDDMANTKFLTNYSSLFKLYANTTEFTYNECVCLLLVYWKFVIANGPNAKMMTKQQLCNLFVVMFRISDMTIVDHILMNITLDVKYVSPDAWMNLFKYFLTTNLEARMEFVFKVYNGNGTLNRERVGMAIEKFFEGDDDDEAQEMRADMSEFIFNKFDTDKDGIISYEEYCVIVVHQPCLLEFLGRVFPDNHDLTLIAYCTNMESLFPFSVNE